MDKRPPLNNKISIQDFKEFYWLKEELVKFCKTENLQTKGGKIEISKRIETYLKTGKRNKPFRSSRTKAKSKFDWNTEKLSLETQLTDNYKNTENVRRFFIEHIGEQFKFNVKFMNWMKANAGKTLNQAIHEWKNIKNDSKKNTKPKDIAPQFEYNRYLRDFMAANPDSNREVGIKLWKIKKSMRGDNVYIDEDLNLWKSV